MSEEQKIDCVYCGNPTNRDINSLETYICNNCSNMLCRGERL